MKLRDFRALTFDCYGTLIDWETGISTALRPLTDRLDRDLSQDEVLQAHGRHESAQQAATPTKRYSDLLAVVYRRLGEEWGVPAPWDECLAYGQSVGDWPAFVDSVDALSYLKEHYRLFILSNVDNVSFARSNERLGVVFDGIYTAEDIGSYKPASENFTYLLDRLGELGIHRSEVLHTAESMFHDHAPANDFDLASCHIYRRSGKSGYGATRDPGELPNVDFQYTSMGELASAHAEEAGA